jgi:multiple sugar transport system substrate-binding protein
MSSLTLSLYYYDVVEKQRRSDLMFKRKSVLAMFIVIALLLAACSSNTNKGSSSSSEVKPSPSASASPSASEKPKNVELRMAWWGSQERHDKTLAAIELFEKSNPHIKITAEYSGFDGYFDKLNTQIAAGNAPDLIQMGGNVKEYADRNALLDLKPYVGNIIHLEDFNENFVNEATFDGKFYGVTLGVSGTGLLYNISMFNKAGIPIPDKNWTYDDFKSITTEISQKLGKGFYGSYDLSGDSSSLGNYLGSSGKELYRNGELKFDKQDMTNWFSMWDELRKAGAIVPAQVQVANDPSAVDKSLIVKGQVAIQSASASQIFGYQEVTEDQLGLLTSPYGSVNNGVAPPVSGQFITSYADTKYPEEVATFINFMVNDPEAATILSNTRGVPPSAKIRDQLAQQSTPVDKVLYDFISLSSDLASNEPFEHFPLDNEFIELLKLTSEKIAFGASTVEQAVNEFMTEMGKLLAKTK